MKVLFEKNDKRMVNVNVTFGAGAISEGTKYKSGLSHMLEHMLFKGTTNRNYEDIAREIEFLGGNSNAFTSYDSVSYILNIPRENLEAGTNILFDMIHNSTIPEDEFLKEREVVIEEYFSYKDEVDYNFEQEISDKFFSGRRRIDIIGTEEDIRAFTREDVNNFYKEFYVPSNCILGISGDVDDKMLEKLSNNLYSNDNIFENMCIDTPHEYKKAQTILVREPDLEQAHLSILYKWPDISKLKDKKYYLFNNILGQGMASRLFMEAREKNNLCYNISSSSDSGKSYGLFSISALTREVNIEKLNNIISIECEKIKNIKVTEYELQAAKNQLLSHIYRILDSKEATLSYRVRGELYDIPFDYYKQSLNEISLIKTDDILDAANEVLDDEYKFECLLIKE